MSGDEENSNLPSKTGLQREMSLEKMRSAGLSRRFVTAYLAVAVSLAVGLAASSILLRRSVEATARDAFQGRAIDLSLGVASTLNMVRADRDSDLREALSLLAEKPVLSIALVYDDGRVWISSESIEEEHHDTIALPGRILSGADHAVEQLSSRGARPVYRTWLPLSSPGRGFRLRRHMSRDKRRDLRVSMPDVEDERFLDAQVYESLDRPEKGKGRGGIGRGLGPGRGRGRRGDFGRARGIFLAVDVEVVADETKRSLERAAMTQWVSLGAAFTLVLVSLLLFLAYRNAGKLENRMLEQQRLAEMGEMGAVLAHEIRNPLGVIKGTAQVLEEKIRDQDEAGRLRMVVDQAQRLERLVNGLLDFARPNDLRKEEQDLRILAEKACAVLESEAVAKRVAVLQDLDSVRVQADPDALMQVLLNLLGNAVHSVEKGGNVVVKARKRGNNAVVEVLDDGAGIPENLGQRIFSPFVTSKSDGCGLGLSVSRRIAEEHGGTLKAENRREGGARFVLTLPL